MSPETGWLPSVVVADVSMDSFLDNVASLELDAPCDRTGSLSRVSESPRLALAEKYSLRRSFSRWGWEVMAPLRGTEVLKCLRGTLFLVSRSRHLMQTDSTSKATGLMALLLSSMPVNSSVQPFYYDKKYSRGISARLANHSQLIHQPPRKSIDSLARRESLIATCF